VRGNALPLLAINEALEAAAQITDRSHTPEIASQIRALKWEDRNAYLRLRNSDRERCGVDDGCGEKQRVVQY